MRSIKGDLGSQKVVKGDEYNGIHPSAKRNQHVAKTNMLCQDIDPGGHMAS